MVIHEIIWPEDRIEHVVAHNITPDEFEEVCFGQPLVLRTKASGQNPVYQVLGQTAAGDYLHCHSFSRWQRRSGDSTAYDTQRRKALPHMETMSKKASIPQTDSIEALARFWDTHDVTDFADELEEVTEPVFVRPDAATVTIELPIEDFAALQQLAQEEQVNATTLLSTWVREKRYYAELLRHARHASQHSA